MNDQPSKTSFGTSPRALEAADGPGINPSANPTLGDVIGARFNRRDILKGALGATAIVATVSPLALIAADKARAASSAFSFPEVAADVDDTHHVADGYDAQVLIRWGDPVLPGAPAFDVASQTAEAQAQQFGYNNDFVGYVPMPGAADPSAHGLLCINLEYTSPALMFPGFDGISEEIAAIEMAAHGVAIVEVMKQDGRWATVPGGQYNRRITVTTPMEVTGPAAGSDRLKTSADPSGTRVLGTVNNCAGAMTPWGTLLSAEENFHGYFWTDEVDAEGKVKPGLGGAEAANYKRYGVPGRSYQWGKFDVRFNLDKEQNEANRFGWVVEIDPLDPASIPKKRTALGRFKHEGAEAIVNGDARVVLYLGDDERFDYAYRFVTSGTYNRTDRAANMGLLDEGTLSVARFDADGTGTWLPLVYGEGPLTEANGFASQADVVIEARRAGDLVGATKMDRPEDFQANPKTGKVYLLLTNNTNRKDEQVDAANPRASNAFGHIIELTPSGGDQAAETFAWEILLRCGDPSVAEVGATFSSDTSKDGWFGMPDNCAIDGAGRLWVATDGQGPKATGRTDGIWAVDTEGDARGTSKLFFRVPVGAEMCGPCFTPDDTTLFLAVQHPGDEGPDWAPFGRESTFEDPSTRWPDFADGMPPRPAVLAIVKQGGGRIGS
jgi:secreted PhoX family phosphatase